MSLCCILYINQRDGLLTHLFSIPFREDMKFFSHLTSTAAEGKHFMFLYPLY